MQLVRQGINLRPRECNSIFSDVSRGFDTSTIPVEASFKSANLSTQKIISKPNLMQCNWSATTSFTTNRIETV